MRTHSLTPVESPSIFGQTMLGVTLHPGQIQWLERRAKVKVAACGRRWGKSYAEAVDLLWFAFTHDETAQFVIAPTADQTSTIFRYTVRMLTLSQLAPFTRKIVQSPFPRVELTNGSTIHARSSGESGKNVRSHGADRLLVDEAAFVPPAALDALMPLLATSAYGEQVYISSPFGRNHFWEMFQRGEVGEANYASYRFPSSSSPYVSQSYLEQQRYEMTTLAYRVEYEAEFAEDQNAVFPWSIIQAATRADLSTEPQPGHQYVIGYDPAKWSDRSGVVVLDITQRPWQTVQVLDLSGRDYTTQAQQIGALSRRYGLRPAVLLDATSHDQMLEQLKADGVNAEGYGFTNASKQELINGLSIALEQGDVLIPEHYDLRTELAYYRYELTAAGNVKLGADHKHHDDLVTALALAVHCAKGQAARPSGRILVSPPRPTIAAYQPR